MKKKVAIRKLNRTLIKKEGTKEVYITGKSGLMSFFGYENVENLPKKRKDEASKKIFINKRMGYDSADCYMELRVTKENGEVRLTGFKNFFEDNKINEVDQIILEYIELDGESRYLLDYFKCKNTRVFQSYSAEDDCENYNVSFDEAGAIRFDKIAVPIEKQKGIYWLWDDSFDESRWSEIINTQIEVVFLNKKKVYNKMIKIEKTEDVVKKLLKAQSNSSRQIKFQEKNLYVIFELVEGEWITADFDGIKNLELVDEQGRIRISNRDAKSFCVYEGGYSE